MKLVSLSDYTLEKNESGLFENSCDKVRKYAEFLQQELTLSMFLPCDKNDKPLKGKPLSPNTDAEWIRWENEEDEYFRAKTLLLFNDVSFKTIQGQGDARFYTVGDTQIFNLSGDHLYWHYNTIEDMLAAYDESITINYSI